MVVLNRYHSKWRRTVNIEMSQEGSHLWRGVRLWNPFQERKVLLIRLKVPRTRRKKLSTINLNQHLNQFNAEARNCNTGVDLEIIEGGPRTGNFAKSGQQKVMVPKRCFNSVFHKIFPKLLTKGVCVCVCVGGGGGWSPPLSPPLLYFIWSSSFGSCYIKAMLVFGIRSTQLNV